MDSYVKCPICGKELHQNQRICSNCGFQREVDSPNPSDKGRNEGEENSPTYQPLFPKNDKIHDILESKELIDNTSVKESKIGKVFSGLKKKIVWEDGSPNSISQDCPTCGHKNPSDSKFCNKCGLKITNSKFGQEENTVEIPDLTAGEKNQIQLIVNLKRIDEKQKKLNHMIKKWEKRLKKLNKRKQKMNALAFGQQTEQIRNDIQASKLIKTELDQSATQINQKIDYNFGLIYFPDEIIRIRNELEKLHNKRLFRKISESESERITRVKLALEHKMMAELGELYKKTELFLEEKKVALRKLDELSESLSNEVRINRPDTNDIQKNRKDLEFFISILTKIMKKCQKVLDGNRFL